MTTYTKVNWVDGTLGGTPLTGANFNVMENGLEAAHNEIVPILPVGAVAWYAKNAPPTAWLECNGAGLDTTTYAALYAVIGYTFGGSGATFNIPDLRGRFVRAYDDSTGRSRLGNVAIGSIHAGSIKPHQHNFDNHHHTSGGGNGSPASYCAYQNGTTTDYTSYAGSASDQDMHPKNMALLPIIRYV
jgi:microcystin-dependent protein